jgi:hypothetical protein
MCQAFSLFVAAGHLDLGWWNRYWYTKLPAFLSLLGILILGGASGSGISGFQPDIFAESINEEQPSGSISHPQASGLRYQSPWQRHGFKYTASPGQAEGLQQVVSVVKFRTIFQSDLPRLFHLTIQKYKI